MNKADKQNLSIIYREIQKKLPGAKIYLFGSLAKNKQKKTSDYDIALDFGQKIDLTILAELEDIFEESDILPTLKKVDIIDLNNISEEFRNIINKYKKLLIYKNGRIEISS